jgi:3-hydroxymyristoyl/3-hydroxydecanoyl-(acyl carrier protein) dehydratase
MTDDFVIEQLTRDGDHAHLRASVPEDLRFFEGHFEGSPMLPGIAQLLALVHRRARDAFGALGAEKGVVRLKFEATIRPGDLLDVHLERRTAPGSGDTQIRFRILRGTTSCASGAIVYG